MRAKFFSWARTHAWRGRINGEYCSLQSHLAPQWRAPRLQASIAHRSGPWWFLRL